jgi:diguanylate cyclase (GGDEF)-like protein
MAGFAALVAALRRRLDTEGRLARTDPLTGLLNLRAFSERAALELERARRSGRPLTVAYLDVDGFKAVNDRLGHVAGDHLLAGIGAALRSGVRAVDAAARLGGDEFVVLLPETGTEAAAELLARLRTRLEAGGARSGGVVSFSIGAVTFTTPPSDVDALVRRADDLMYAVKADGRNGLRHETVAGDQA